jgi:cell shape-determining protein MreC
VSVEQRILDVANGARFSPTWYDLTELRLIALEARKMDDRIKQLEQENDALRADLLLWNEKGVK